MTEPNFEPGDPMHDPDYIESEPDFEKYPIPPPTNPDDGAM